MKISVAINASLQLARYAILSRGSIMRIIDETTSSLLCSMDRMRKKPILHPGHEGMEELWLTPLQREY
jgi:hypothetical protein